KVVHFNFAYFTMLLDMVGRSVMTGTGETFLSDLICYLFATTEDFQLCEQDSSSNADGFNLIARNSNIDDPAMSELGRYIATDWRYWSRGITIAELFSTAAKLRLAGLRSAILFTRDSDASADPQRLRATTQQIYQQDQLSIIILTQANLFEIEKRQTTF